MRMSKAETVAKYRDMFLAGKNEETVRKFDEKDLEKQYVSISQWKRRQENLDDNNGATNEYSYAYVVDNLKKAGKTLKQLDNLTSKEAARLNELLEALKDVITNFSKIKDQRELQALISEKEMKEREAENINKRIEELKQKLGH